MTDSAHKPRAHRLLPDLIQLRRVLPIGIRQVDSLRVCSCAVFVFVSVCRHVRPGTRGASIEYVAT